MKPNSAYFDFVGAANQGYATVWNNRAVLLRLAGLPLLIKFGCLAAIVLFGFEGQILRHGLVMLPSYFAEGFLIAYVIRTIHAGGDLSADVKQAQHYFNDVIAAMIVFVLVQMTLTFLIGNTIAGIPEGADQVQQPVPSLQIFMMAMFTIAFMIWAFRFAWFHVPLAMGIPLKDFMERIHPFSSSLPMLGCWFMCFLPTAFVMMLVSRGVVSILPQVEGGANTLPTLLLFYVQGSFEMLVNVLCGIAMSYGFKSLMEKK